MIEEYYLLRPILREEPLTAGRSTLNRSNQLWKTCFGLAYESALMTLASAIEIHDLYKQGHVESVRNIASMFANIFCLKRPQVDSSRFGAFLHDVAIIRLRRASH